MDEDSPLGKLIAMASGIAVAAEEKEQQNSEAIYKMGSNGSGNKQWQDHLQKGLSETLEAGQAFFELIANPALHYQSRPQASHSNKERHLTYQDPRFGAIWCFVSETRFVLGSMMFPFDYLARLQVYIDQMHQQNVKLKDERTAIYKSIKSQANRSIYLRDVFPEAAGMGNNAELTEDNMTEWEIQVNWWEQTYITEIKKHAEGFGYGALTGGDLMTAIDCFEYLKLIDKNEVVEKIQSNLNQLAGDDHNEPRIYLRQVAERLQKIQIKTAAAQPQEAQPAPLPTPPAPL